jgi:tetratricopeptide (TPR) repeat protein
MRLRRLWIAGFLCAICPSMPEQGVAQERAAPTNHLTLAAAFLEKGETHPDHRNARFYHAELLMKLGRHAAARGEFETVIAREQAEIDPDLKHLVYCHTRLREAGDALGDDYLVHLHRGIGMLLLARRCAALGNEVAGPSSEAMMFKAIAALKRARTLRSDEARPCWYLHVAWQQLGQDAPARRWLAEAQRRAPLTELTPAERRDLMLAANERLRPLPPPR